MFIEINTGTAFQNFALDVLLKIDVGSMTSTNNFDRGHPVVLIMTIIFNIQKSSNKTFTNILRFLILF